MFVKQKCKQKDTETSMKMRKKTYLLPGDQSHNSVEAVVCR